MHRVLSFQLGRVSGGRGFGESSEFVTKRMCFSFIFFFGFLALLGGFLLGRMSTERNIEIRKERERIELANDALKVTELPKIQYNQLLEELRNITSFDQFLHFTKRKTETGTGEDALRVGGEALKTILSNSSLHLEVSQQRSSIVATFHGSQEPDRWIALSVSGNGTILALELVRIFGKLKMDYNWKPRRTIKFCFFEEPDADPCHDILSKYFKSRIVAYIAVHGKVIQKRGCPVASGSDIIKSMVVETVQESISAVDSDNGIFDSCKIGDETQRQISMPRIALDIPHSSLSFETGNSASSEFSNELEMLPYRKALIQIIGRSVWKLSDDLLLKWDPEDFERGVKTALRMLNSSNFSEVKGYLLHTSKIFPEKILSTTFKLVKDAENLNQRINSTDNSSPLDSRMKNDLLMDLDKALLCPDVDSRSKTDLDLIPGLLSVNSHQEAVSTFLSNMLECYNDAVEILREG